jgi:hypothetical protein
MLIPWVETNDFEDQTRLDDEREHLLRINRIFSPRLTTPVVQARGWRDPPRDTPSCHQSESPSVISHQLSVQVVRAVRVVARGGAVIALQRTPRVGDLLGRRRHDSVDLSSARLRRCGHTDLLLLRRVACVATCTRALDGRWPWCDALIGEPLNARLELR